MRPIKFRGKTLTRDETVKGDLLHKRGSLVIAITPNIRRNVKSARQLCFVENGREYYEGDFKREKGVKYVCKLEAIWEVAEDVLEGSGDGSDMRL